MIQGRRGTSEFRVLGSMCPAHHYNAKSRGIKLCEGRATYNSHSNYTYILLIAPVSFPKEPMPLSKL